MERGRVFVLSPANLSGVRGGKILARRGKAPFMGALVAGDRVPLGDVYAFISSLYYRGKRTYARRFGRRPAGGPASLVVTPCSGLVPDDHPVTFDDLETFAASDVDPRNPGYRSPLLRSAVELRERLDTRAEVVLLGSIATDKYVEPLAEVFHDRLLFPEAFIGRGDMSRGGLLLRSVEVAEELTYVQAISARRTGSRPPRLEPSSSSAGA